MRYLPMSEMGLVSRVSPVQTALRNCSRDEGRSFEVGNQVLISSHRKLLLSKAMVAGPTRQGWRSGRGSAAFTIPDHLLHRGTPRLRARKRHMQCSKDCSQPGPLPSRK